MSNDLPQSNEPSEDRVAKAMSRIQEETYYEKTRLSLLEGLGNWEDSRKWDEFYKIYWRLLQKIALNSGLRPDETGEVVQDTLLTIAKQFREGVYDPKKGSFKSWLVQICKWKIQDQLRKRKKETAMLLSDDNTELAEHPLNAIADEQNDFENNWDRELTNSLLIAAMARVKAKVATKHFQIYDCYVNKEWSVSKVCQHLGVSAPQVYLAKNRVGKVLRKELEELKDQMDDPRFFQ